MSPRPALSSTQRAQGKKLAGRLADVRRQRNQAQSELARRSGVPLDTIRALEHNRIAAPSFFTVARIAGELDLDLGALARETLID